jgi:hypothetical protein
LLISTNIGRAYTQPRPKLLLRESAKDSPDPHMFPNLRGEIEVKLCRWSCGTPQLISEKFFSFGLG